MSFERFTLVRVPFPFTDRAATKNRPALILSDVTRFNHLAGHEALGAAVSARPPAPSA